MQLLQSRALPLGYPAASAKHKQYGWRFVSQVKVQFRQAVISRAASSSHPGMVKKLSAKNRNALRFRNFP